MGGPDPRRIVVIRVHQALRLRGIEPEVPDSVVDVASVEHVPYKVTTFLRRWVVEVAAAHANALL